MHGLHRGFASAAALVGSFAVVVAFHRAWTFAVLGVLVIMLLARALWGAIDAPPRYQPTKHDGLDGSRLPTPGESPGIGPSGT